MGSNQVAYMQHVHNQLMDYARMWNEDTQGTYNALQAIRHLMQLLPEEQFAEGYRLRPVWQAYLPTKLEGLSNENDRTGVQRSDV